MAVKAAQRQRTSHRPGTQQARASAVRLLLAFTDKAKLNYKRMTYYQVCWFLEYLATAGYTPGSISNTLSHVRTYLKLASISDDSWHHYRVGLAMRAISINIRHIPDPKDPVSPAILRAVLENIKEVPSYLAVRLALLMMFMGFMRQSSLAPLTTAAFDPTRHLTPEDVTASAQHITVRVKWTKTIQKSSDAKTLMLPATKDKNLCPVRAYHTYMEALAPRRAGPLLIFQDGQPITTRFIARQWTALLKLAGIAPGRHSLHSLRRGGAGFTYNEKRADLNDVMTQGTWRSMAVREYIEPPDNQYNTVHKALRRL